MAAVAASQGIKSNLIPGIATAFCSGFSETGGTCGALNGAVLAVSMVEGRRTIKDKRESVYGKTQQLVLIFQEKFQATKCPDLIQIELGTPRASEEYQTRGLHKQCETYIREMAYAAAELLQEESLRSQSN